MASPSRLARSAKARAAAPKAQDDRFEAFVTELAWQLQQRLDTFHTESPVRDAFCDVWFSVRHAARKAGVDL